MDIIVGYVRKEGEEIRMVELDDNKTVKEMRRRYEESSGKKDDIEQP